MDTPYTYVHDRSNLRVGTYISINNSGIEIFLYDFCPNLIEIMWTCLHKTGTTKQSPVKSGSKILVYMYIKLCFPVVLVVFYIFLIISNKINNK